ncbi:MAG: TonB family protein [Methyloprofundus sp.]|nr:TonB family protein [Methyloprofundus sp.]
MNHSISAQDAELIFSVDSSDCFNKITRDRPIVYEDCAGYGFNPAMEKNCLRENKTRLSSYKKQREKLYRRCLKKKGWEESVPVKMSGSIEIMERAAPVYPAEARALCLEGKVKLGFVIAQDGSVKDIRIFSAKPEGVFDRAAIEAVSKWRFKPVMVDGKLVEQSVAQELQFVPDMECTQEVEALVK